MLVVDSKINSLQISLSLAAATEVEVVVIVTYYHCCW